jgi:hypothetical protein
MTFVVSEENTNFVLEMCGMTAKSMQETPKEDNIL